MKRVKAAFIQQTLHFQLKENLEHSAAVHAVQEEYEHYKRQLDRKGTKYRILSEQTQPDGSLLVQIKKQYNDHDCGDYLD